MRVPIKFIKMVKMLQNNCSLTTRSPFVWSRKWSIRDHTAITFNPIPNWVKLIEIKVWIWCISYSTLGRRNDSMTKCWKMHQYCCIVFSYILTAYMFVIHIMFQKKVELKKEQTVDRNYSTLYLRITERGNKRKQYYLLSKKSIVIFLSL